MSGLFEKGSSHPTCVAFFPIWSINSSTRRMQSSSVDVSFPANGA